MTCIFMLLCLYTFSLPKMPLPAFLLSISLYTHCLFVLNTSDQAGLKLAMHEDHLAPLVLLPPPHRCWDDRHVPPCLVYVFCGFLCMRQALYQLNDTLATQSLGAIASVSPFLCSMLPSPSSPTHSQILPIILQMCASVSVMNVRL